MKKFLLSLLAVTAAIGASAESVTFVQAKLLGDDEGYTSSSTNRGNPNIDEFLSDKLDIVCDKGFNNKGFSLFMSNIRIYPGNTMTITPKDGSGVVITGISFTYEDAVRGGADSQSAPMTGIYYYGEDNPSQGVDFVTSGRVLSWEKNPSDNITKLMVYAPESGEARITSFTVNYDPAPAPSDVEKPVISGTTPFEDSTTVTITGSGEVFYTIDGKDPNAESTLYEGPFTITETTDVRAVNYVSGKASDVVSMLFVKESKGPQLPQILVDGAVPAEDNISLKYGQSCEISFKEVPEGTDVMYSIQLVGGQPTGEAEVYTKPFEITESSYISYWSKAGSDKSESATFSVYIAKAPQVIDGLPENVEATPVPGDVKASDFANGIAFKLDGASIIVGANECTAKFTCPDGSKFTRFMFVESLATDEIFVKVNPDNFSQTGKYLIEVDLNSAVIETALGGALVYPVFRIEYNVTKTGGGQTPGVPDNVSINPNPGRYDEFPQDHITITFTDIYTMLGADGKELLTVTYPDASIKAYSAFWSTETPNAITFAVPEGEFAQPGTYSLTLDMEGVQIFKDEQGNVGTVNPFAFEYVIGKSSVDVIAADEADAKYFDLNGRRVYGDLLPGIYVKHTPGKTVKVIVK